ncbi:hypothetical protein GOP47_0007952 [Adiantum capillus-veneris]|uniref:F-box domain-containing protein n=1 Tax=Adiantum capillus-veneris TaxID=13818 RepID=A0A9D4ZJQ9_ADICA|nr:hypothetical protein GOP47_0007952 [Adiantum capillus-veneris]
MEREDRLNILAGLVQRDTTESSWLASVWLHGVARFLRGGSSTSDVQLPTAAPIDHVSPSAYITCSQQQLHSTTPPPAPYNINQRLPEHLLERILKEMIGGPREARGAAGTCRHWRAIVASRDDVQLRRVALAWKPSDVWGIPRTTSRAVRVFIDGLFHVEFALLHDGQLWLPVVPADYDRTPHHKTLNIDLEMWDYKIVTFDRVWCPKTTCIRSLCHDAAVDVDANNSHGQVFLVHASRLAFYTLLIRWPLR